ncbi:unnamed protein product, partial [Nesidiocoris tenuis]
MPRTGRKFTFQRDINFWIPGDYKFVINRVKFGLCLVDRMISFMKDRTGAELASDRRITKWRRKWTSFLSNEAADQGIVVDVMRSIMDAHVPRLEMNRGMIHIVSDQ